MRGKYINQYFESQGFVGVAQTHDIPIEDPHLETLVGSKSLSTPRLEFYFPDLIFEDACFMVRDMRDFITLLEMIGIRLFRNPRPPPSSRKMSDKFTSPMTRMDSKECKP